MNNNLGEEIIDKAFARLRPEYVKGKIQTLIVKDKKLAQKQHCSAARRLIAYYFRDIFTIISIVDSDKDKVTIIYFIYENQYCRLCVTENEIYAEYLSSVRYNKKLKKSLRV